MSKSKLIVIALLISIILNFVLLMIPDKNKSLISNIIGNPEPSWLVLEKNDKSCFARPINKVCIFNKDKNKKIVLIGDSHMASLSSSFRNLANSKKVELTIITGCPFYFKLIKTWHYDRKDCTLEINNKIFEKIKNKKNTLFIFHNRYISHINKNSVLSNQNNSNNQKKFELKNTDYYFKGKDTSSLINENIFAKSYDDLFETLENKNNSFMIILPTPEAIYNPREKIKKFIHSKSKFFNNDLQNKLNFERSFYEKRIDKTLKVFKNIKNLNLKIINPADVFCDKKKCFMFRDNNLLYFDHSHISEYAAKQIYKMIEIDIESHLLNK